MFSKNAIFLKKLKLTPCNEDGTVINKHKPFEVMLNPEYYSVKSSIQYTVIEVANGKDVEYKYVGHTAREIVLAPLILDVTGAVPYTLSALYKSLNEVIEHLEKVTYKVDGDAHEPPVILLEWGDFSEKVRLDSMDVKYTLFAENGDPLRAEVSLTLSEYRTPQEIAAEQKTASPDMTHLVEVKDGDTLPLMCNRIYKDCSYYREVAEINGLDDFRHLVPGTFLYFPPLAD